MKNYHFGKKSSIIVTLLMLTFFVAACSDTAVESEEPEVEQEVEREKIELKLESMAYDPAQDAMVATLSTNLPEGTEMSVAVRGPSTLLDLRTDVKITEDEVTTVSFPFEDVVDKYEFVTGQYDVIAYVDINGDDTYVIENEHLLHDPVIGGNSPVMAEEYAGIGDHVEVTQFLEDEPVYDEDYNYLRYELKIVSVNKLSVQSVLTDEEIAEKNAKDLAEAEQAYVTKMQEHAGKVQEQFITFSDAFANPQFGDFDWMVDLSVAITEISRLSEEPSSYVAPKKYIETHQLYLKAMDDYKTAMDILPTALDNMDSTQINEAANYMDRALQKVKEVHAKIAE